MLAHTKKHHTEAVAIKFIGPVTNRKKPDKIYSLQSDD